MENEKIFDVTEFKDIKEIVYNSASKYSENIAFVIKHQENKKIQYENITYKKLLEDVNSLGTSFYKHNIKGKIVAIIGRNMYEWFVEHLSNLFCGIV